MRTRIRSTLLLLTAIAAVAAGAYPTVTTGTGAGPQRAASTAEPPDYYHDI